MGEMAWEIQEYGNHLSTVFIGQNMQLFFQPQGAPPCPCPQVSMVTSPLVHVTRGFLENDFHKKNANSLV